MKNHETMTLDECCSEIGWERAARGLDGVSPDPTLDSIAAAMPEGFIFVLGAPGSNNPKSWMAEGFREHDSGRQTHVAYADTELLARARLAVACWRASKGSTR